VDTIISKDGLFPQLTGAVPCPPTAELTMDDETAEPTLVSLNRLRSAVVELSTALNETLRDERRSAAARLQRAQAILRGVDSTSLQQVANGVRQGLAPWQVRKVLAHIEANLGTHLRNRDLAAVARLSEYHFNVAFRKSVGEAPHGYIIRRRVERAQGLMLSTEKPLSDIALECGLADQAHFTRLFRTIVGESPAVWRRARANPPG
jgi:transcriptional regulator GlxA family with amidase domain